jgi:hypothetical protein
MGQSQFLQAVLPQDPGLHLLRHGRGGHRPLPLSCSGYRLLGSLLAMLDVRPSARVSIDVQVMADLLSASVCDQEAVLQTTETNLVKLCDAMMPLRRFASSWLSGFLCGSQNCGSSTVGGGHGEASPASEHLP